MSIAYEVYFRRPDDCVVFAPANVSREISLLHRTADGQWHCALCDTTRCRHTEAAEAGEAGRAGIRAVPGEGRGPAPPPG